MVDDISSLLSIFSLIVIFVSVGLFHTHTHRYTPPTFHILSVLLRLDFIAEGIISYEVLGNLGTLLQEKQVLLLFCIFLCKRLNYVHSVSYSHCFSGN